jgi:hypothetical protein
MHPNSANWYHDAAKKATHIRLYYSNPLLDITSNIFVGEI